MKKQIAPTQKKILERAVEEAMRDPNKKDDELQKARKVFKREAVETIKKGGEEE